MAIMGCEHGWKEEEIVDFVLDRLPVEKNAAFSRHVETCTACRNSLHEWETIVGKDSTEVPGAPSPKVKRRLMKEIEGSGIRRGLQVRKPAMAFIAACVLLLTVVGTGMFAASSRSGDIQRVNGQPQVAPQTGNQKVRYVPVSDHNVKGYVWVNGATDEMMLFLNGLSRIDGKDYQAWLVSEGHQANAGLLKVNHGMAHLYYQGPQMEDVRHIVVSVEPHGGSEFETGPEKFLIELSRSNK